MVSVTKGRVVNSNYAVHRFQNTNVTVITPVSFEKGRGQKKKKKSNNKGECFDHRNLDEGFQMAPSGLVMFVLSARLGCHWCMCDLHIILTSHCNQMPYEWIRNGIISLFCGMHFVTSVTAFGWTHESNAGCWWSTKTEYSDRDWEN